MDRVIVLSDEWVVVLPAVLFVAVVAVNARTGSFANGWTFARDLAV